MAVILVAAGFDPKADGADFLVFGRGAAGLNLEMLDGLDGMPLPTMRLSPCWLEVMTGTPCYIEFGEIVAGAGKMGVRVPPCAPGARVLTISCDRSAQGEPHLFVAIDRTSKLAFIEVREGHSAGRDRAQDVQKTYLRRVHLLHVDKRTPTIRSPGPNI